MKGLYCLVFIALLFSCSPGALSPQELQAYVQDEFNGLTQKVEVNGYQLKLTYRPTDLWVHQEVGDNMVAVGQLDTLRNKYNNYYYFILSLSRNNKEALHQVGSMDQYSELVQTLSFRMPQYTTLTTTASDTIPVGDFMLNRTYGMSTSTDLLFVFSREKALDDEWVQFNLNEFGLGTGNQRFRFKRKQLEEAPIIKFTTN
jgi:hypothetical protein